MSFDAIASKTAIRQPWEDAAEAWHRWGPVLETWLGEAGGPCELQVLAGTR